MNVRGMFHSLGKIGRVLLACFVTLALFLHNTTVAHASTSMWTAQNPNTYLSINALAHGKDGNGNGLWVAAQQAGLIDTSPDGVTWTWTNKQVVAGDTNYFYSVAYGTVWVLVGMNGDIVTSPDGSTWTDRNPNNSLGLTDLYNVTYGGSTYVAVGPGGLAVTSLDGVTWTSHTVNGAPNLEQVAYGGGVFVATADGGGIYTSTDGITWTHQTSGTSNDLYAVTYGGGQFVAVGDKGTIRTSSNGVSWTSQTSGTTNQLYGVTYGSGKLIAVGYTLDSSGSLVNNSYTIISSVDGGATWTSEPPPSEPADTYIDCVAYGASQFIAGGEVWSPQNAILLTQPYSNNDNLSGLSLSSGTLSPAFASDTTSYTASVPYSVTSVNVTPTTADSTATLKVNGNDATSGGATSVSLNTGINIITVVVTALSGGQKTYTVTVTRAAASTNANLSDLTLDQGTLTPTFSSGTTSYTASVQNSVTSVNVTPTTADSTATLKVNGNDATSGGAVPVSLNVGDNTITVLVTAQDGRTTQTYTVTATRAPSSNADLSGLTLSQGTLSPAFASGTTSYTADVAYTVTSVDVTPTVADSAATVKVNGNSVTSGSGEAVNLKVGDNPITVLVTAPDGKTTQTYTVTVTRAPSSNADLSALTLDQSTLTPSFASGTTSYTANVPYSVTSVNVTPTVADSTATVTVNGNAATSGSAVPVTVTVGSNTITVIVTAQDGTTAKTYTVTVARVAPSSNADLSNLTFSHGTLTPSFASGTTDYTVSVPYNVSSVNVTPTVADNTASVTVNGNAASSGNLVPVRLKVGSNTITVVVKAQDGTTTKTYTVTATRAGVPTGGGPGNGSGGGNHPGGGGGSGNPSYPPLPIVVLSQPVNPAGGTIHQNVGDLTIDINVPEGAFGESEQLTVTAGTPADVSQVISGLSTNSAAFVIGVSFSGAAPTKPVTVTISSPVILPNGVLYKLTSSGELVPLTAQVNQGKVTVSFTSDPDFVVLNVKATQRVIALTGHANIVPSIVQPDAAVQTTYIPIWYVMQLLKGIGIDSTWDGHNWRMDTSRWTDVGRINAGTGGTHIYLNGTLVQNVNTIAAMDPSANAPTTYMPIWYVMQLLNRVHVQSAWNGTTWTLTDGDQS